MHVAIQKLFRDDCHFVERRILTCVHTWRQEWPHLIHKYCLRYLCEAMLLLLELHLIVA